MRRLAAATAAAQEHHRAERREREGRHGQGEEGRDKREGRAQNFQVKVLGWQIPVSAEVLEVVVLVLHVPLHPGARAFDRRVPQPWPQDEQHDWPQRGHGHKGERDARQAQAPQVAPSHPQVMCEEKNREKPRVVFRGEGYSPEDAAQNAPARRAQGFPVGECHQHRHHGDGHIEAGDLCVKEVVRLGHRKHSRDYRRYGPQHTSSQPIDQRNAQTGEQDSRKTEGTRIALEKRQGDVAPGDRNGMQAALGCGALAGMEQAPGHAEQDLHQGRVFVVVVPDAVHRGTGKGLLNVSFAQIFRH